MLTLNHIGFGYADGILFKDLNLMVTKGGVCGLLGKNGAGKTTLLKMIAGLIFPHDGFCRVLDYTPQKRQPICLQEIYFLPEEIWVPSLNSRQYIQYYAQFYPRFDVRGMENYLQEFNLPEDKLLDQMSHGQKKKFLIAFGLATGCRILLLDEPTNGLDIPSKAEFRKLLASVASDEKLLMISTHQVHDVENMLDSTIILDSGNIIFYQNMSTIARRLVFLANQSAADASTCLYSERRLGGYVTVAENTTDQETPVDLELLFNAVMMNPQRIATIFVENRS